VDDVILRTVSRVLIPFIMVFGAYVVFHGHVSPGGAFAGGALMASAFILGSMALGQSSGVGRSWGAASRVLESAGGIWYVFLGFIGIALGTGFLSNAVAGFPLGRAGYLVSGGLIPLLSVGLGIKVTATLVSLFRTLARGYQDD
jgi:multicomponent Na+:H+ antiporter subunit B